MTSTLIAPEQLASMLDEVTLLDVRSPAEFESGHIPGAVNVPVDVLGSNAHRVQVDAPVVLICQAGPRAVQADQHLQAAGLQDTLVLEGGMGRWDDGTREVLRGKQRWALERQVRLVAGSLVLSSILASIRYPRARALAGMIGGGLTFSALSNTCAMGNALSRLPYNRGADYDAEAALDQLG